MSKKPMKVVPDGLYPPEIKTPEEKFNFLGRKLFALKPEALEKTALEDLPKPSPRPTP